MSSSWVIYNISPNTFNVLSDLTGMAIVALFAWALHKVYPFLVWHSVQRGKPVPVESIVSPPTLWDTFLTITHRRTADNKTETPQSSLPSLWILVALPFALFVANFAHAVSDAFLEFDSVTVRTEDAYFLSNAPGGLPSYALLGDRQPYAVTVPGLAQARLLAQADRIAQGASRFSLFPPDLIGWTENEIMDGLVVAQKSNMFTQGLDNSQGRTIPSQLNVKCKAISDTVPENWHSHPFWANDSDLKGRFSSDVNAVQYANMAYEHNNGTLYIERLTEFVTIPDCDYENPVVPDSINAVQSLNDDWKVLDWTSFKLGPNGGSCFSLEELEKCAFGAQYADETGLLWWARQFSRNETQLPLTRHPQNDSNGAGWHHGRATMDGIVLGLGIVANDTSRTRYWNEYYNVHPKGLRIPLHFSVLSGPGESNPISGDSTTYALSSWSRNCPIVEGNNEEGGNATLTLLKFPAPNASNASGCIIDVLFYCFDYFPQDKMNTTQHSSSIPPCIPMYMTSALISHLEVDRSMLAAYAGIATRNNALQVGFGVGFQRVAMNSIAAAYILTRKVVSGEVPVEGVRAKIGPLFLLFMILPLAIVVPFFFLVLIHKLKASSFQSLPPVPTSLWEVMIFGKGQEAVPNHHQECGECENNRPFPTCPKEIKFGFTSSPCNGSLGLGLSVVPVSEEGSVKTAGATRSTTQKEGGLGSLQFNTPPARTMEDEEHPQDSSIPSSSVDLESSCLYTQKQNQRSPEIATPVSDIIPPHEPPPTLRENPVDDNHGGGEALPSDELSG